MSLYCHSLLLKKEVDSKQMKPCKTFLLADNNLSRNEKRWKTLKLEKLVFKEKKTPKRIIVLAGRVLVSLSGKTFVAIASAKQQDVGIMSLSGATMGLTRGSMILFMTNGTSAVISILPTVLGETATMMVTMTAISFFPTLHCQSLPGT